MQDFALGIAETRGVHTGSLFKPLWMISFLQEISSTIQLDVAFKLVENALNPTFYVIDEGIK